MLKIFISNLFKTKSCKVRSIELTINLLAAYHAVTIDNEQFQKQYRHLFQMLTLIKGHEQNV